MNIFDIVTLKGGRKAKYLGTSGGGVATFVVGDTGETVSVIEAQIAEALETEEPESDKATKGKPARKNPIE